MIWPQGAVVMVGYEDDVLIEFGLGSEGQSRLNQVAFLGIEVAKISYTDSVVAVAIPEDLDLFALGIHSLLYPVLVTFSK
jgi:hypothetical protein